MSSMTTVNRELDPRRIGARVVCVHDQTREEFRADTTAGDYTDFTCLAVRHVQCHYQRRVASGGKPPRANTASIVQPIVKRERRRQGYDVSVLGIVETRFTTH